MSAKNYTKKKAKRDRRNPRTNGENKAIQTKSHKETYTLTKREKGNIYIYISIFKKKEESNQIYKHIYQ